MKHNAVKINADALFFSLFEEREVKLILGISDYVVNFLMRNINKKANLFSSKKA